MQRRIAAGKERPECRLLTVELGNWAIWAFSCAALTVDTLKLFHNQSVYAKKLYLFRQKYIHLTK
ncbi:MAG: hypothetical protein ACRC10_03670 [Thermoguttaceae bacterium]